MTSQDIEHRYLISLIREVSTASSRDQGEWDEVTFDIEREPYESDELARLIRDKGISQWEEQDWRKSAPGEVRRLTFKSQMPEENRAFFEQDEHVYYLLAILAIDEQPVEDLELAELYGALPKSLIELLPAGEVEPEPEDDGPSP